MSIPTLKSSTARLIARILSIILFFLWGLFFVEHLSWFGSLQHKSPPLTIWLLSFLHGILLISYLVSLEWETAGSITMIASAILFFSFVAKINAIPFIIISITPAMLYYYCRMNEKRVEKTT